MFAARIHAGIPQFWGQKQDEDAAARELEPRENAAGSRGDVFAARRGGDVFARLRVSKPNVSPRSDATGVENDGHSPCSVSAGTMASGAHSFFAHVCLPPDAQKPGVQLRASSHRSNGAPSAIGSSHPDRDSAPASGQEASCSETRFGPKDAFAPRASRVASDEARVSGRDEAAAV